MKRNDLEFYTVNAEQWWDENATIYRLNYLNPARFNYFDRHLAHWRGVRVLDVGCGGGFTSEFLAQRGAIVAGIDQSSACIEAAKNHAVQGGLTINYQQGVAEVLPYSDTSFDCVVCVDVLEHVANLRHTLQEIYRVLKPGGFFFFDTINRTLKSKIIMIWLLENILHEIPRGVHDWSQFIRPDELSEHLNRIGFRDIEIQGFNIFGETIVDHLRAYRYYKQTRNFQICINDDRSVMYIGKAVKI